MEKVKILYDYPEITEAIRRIGSEITRDYQGVKRDIVAVCILKGAVLFYSDLVKEIKVPVLFDFMDVSSYGNNTTSSGEVKITHDLVSDIADKDVILIDDIVDSGYTMINIVKLLKLRNPHSIKVCCLLDKPSRRKVDLKPDYCGFEIPDLFVYGYGLDNGQKSRNLPYIAVKED